MRLQMHPGDLADARAQRTAATGDAEVAGVGVVDGYS